MGIQGTCQDRYQDTKGAAQCQERSGAWPGEARFGPILVKIII